MKQSTIAFTMRTRIAFCSVAAFIFVLAASLTAGESISVPTVGIKTIGQAMINAKAGDTVLVDDGVYRELVLVKSGVMLVARNSLKAVIDGGGKGTVVTLGASCTVNGFEIRNGTIGVTSRDAGNAIVNCRIVKNWETGIICVRHLPKIEDNVIAFNRASGIQGWNVRSTSTSVNHNTIAFNSNHGIALGGVCDVVIENNMITFNERFGVKISSTSERTQLVKNNIYGNLSFAKKLPPDNYSYDPNFSSPRARMNFTVETKQPCCMYGSDNQVLGTRLTVQ